MVRWESGDETRNREPEMWLLLGTAAVCFLGGWITRGWFGRDDRARDELATMRRWL